MKTVNRGRSKGESFNVNLGSLGSTGHKQKVDSRKQDSEEDDQTVKNGAQHELLAFIFDGSNDLVGRVKWVGARLGRLVHATVFFTLTGDRVSREVRPNVARIDHCHVNIVSVNLCPKTVTERLQGML